eukprot:scaffold107403_cov66-Phaeocystis_antarctica.AAC.2
MILDPPPHSRPRSDPARTLTPPTHTFRQAPPQTFMISQKCDLPMQFRPGSGGLWHIPPFETRKTMVFWPV